MSSEDRGNHQRILTSDYQSILSFLREIIRQSTLEEIIAIHHHRSNPPISDSRMILLCHVIKRANQPRPLGNAGQLRNMAAWGLVKDGIARGNGVRK
jgi:hypothetical protein